MVSKEMNISLFKKLYVEQQKFRSWYMELNDEEKEKTAEEYAFSQGVLAAVEHNVISDKVCKSLLENACPLKALYGYWKSWKGNMDILVIPVMEQFADMNSGYTALEET